MASNITYWFEFPSNFSNGTAVEGVGQLLQYSNYTIGGWLGVIILMVMWVVSFILTKGFGSEKSFTVATFGTAFMSVLLMRINLISINWVIALAIASVLGIILTRNSAERSSI